MYEYVPAKVDLLRKIVRGEKIGHSQMIELIEQWTGVRVPLNRGKTVFKDRDFAFVMRLKRRVADPATKGAPVSDDPADWEFAWISFWSVSLRHETLAEARSANEVARFQDH